MTYLISINGSSECHGLDNSYRDLADEQKDHTMSHESSGEMTKVKKGQSVLISRRPAADHRNQVRRL